RDRIPQVRLPRPPDPLPVTNQPFAAVDSQRVEPDAPLARPAARVPPAATPALLGHWLETAGAWLLGLLWLLPLVYAVWTAFHPPAYATRFELDAPLTLENFVAAWNAAPFARYFLNTVLLV